MCGSNAAGKPKPLHIMFSSTASNEDNYSVNATWLLGMPIVHTHFEIEVEQYFRATVTINE